MNSLTDCLPNIKAQEFATRSHFQSGKRPQTKACKSLTESVSSQTPAALSEWSQRHVGNCRQPINFHEHSLTQEEERTANKERDGGIDFASHVSEGTRVASVERAEPLSELSSPPPQYGDSAPHGSVAPGASQRKCDGRNTL